MAFSNRERLISFGTVAAIALFSFDRLVWSPYSSHMDELASQLQAANAEKAAFDLSLRRRDHLQTIWSELQQGGLELNDSKAQSQALHAINDEWAVQSGVQHLSLNAKSHFAGGWL